MASQRNRTQREYEILGLEPAQPKIKHVELNLGNTCNLRCLMCNDSFSSAILAENHRLGLHHADQKNQQWGDDALPNLRALLAEQPRLINVLGGEPFYNRRFLTLLDSISETQAQNMVLNIVTNATSWNDQWRDALAKFKLVRLMFSVDATHALYEYMRFPAEWSVTENNIQAMRSGHNVKTLVHCVVQNLNVARLGTLISWCHEQDLHLNFDLLTQPNFLAITNLPEPDRLQAIHALEQNLDQNVSPANREFLQSCLERVTQCHFDPAAWQAFRQHVQPRDRLRGNNYQTWLGA